MQMMLLIRVLSYAAGVSPEWYVSMSLDPWSDFPPGRGRVVTLALTVEIQPVQWKRGWQLEKIHSQSERSAEAGMPTFQSSDRSTLGSVPGHSWLNARPGSAHSKAYLSSSQRWSMEPLGSSFIVQYGTTTEHFTNRCRWRMTIGSSVGRWGTREGLPMDSHVYVGRLVINRLPLTSNRLLFVNQSRMTMRKHPCFAVNVSSSLLAGAHGVREEPRFVTARAGESVILGCDVSPPLDGQQPPYVVEWFKFGVPIPFFINFRFYPPHVDPEYTGEMSVDVAKTQQSNPALTGIQRHCFTWNRFRVSCFWMNECLYPGKNQDQVLL